MEPCSSIIRRHQLQPADQVGTVALLSVCGQSCHDIGPPQEPSLEVQHLVLNFALQDSLLTLEATLCQSALSDSDQERAFSALVIMLVRLMVSACAILLNGAMDTLPPDTCTCRGKFQAGYQTCSAQCSTSAQSYANSSTGILSCSASW